MTRLITFIIVVIGLSSCNQDRIFQSDIEKLIHNKKKSTEDILGQLDGFIQKHGKDGFEFQNGIVKDFFKTHKIVMSFIDSLDNIDKRDRLEATNDFIEKNFKKYAIKYPYEVSLTKDTPLDVIKFEIVDLENGYLREWEENVSHRFNNVSATIIPDKIGFSDTEKITGTIGFMAYSDNLKLKIRMNEKDIEVKNGMGYFSIDPKELKEGQGILKAEIIFPDTIYTTTILVNKNR
jgi:hypothetical protein